jgi:hypothetical protein
MCRALAQSSAPDLTGSRSAFARRQGAWVAALVLAHDLRARAHRSSVSSRWTRVVTRGPSAVMTTFTSERTPKSGR